MGLSLVYGALGRKAEADSTLREVERDFADEGAYQVAELYAYRGEADKAFEWLERAYRQRDGGLAHIQGDRLFDNVRGDPRYRSILRKLKLSE